MMRKFFSLCLCCMILFSIFPICEYSYATAPSGEGWVPCNSRDNMVAAWKSYCAAKNSYTIVSDDNSNNLLQDYINWDYNTLYKTAAFLGIDLDALQAKCWYYTNENTDSFTKFFFENTAISDLNRLYSQYCSEYSVEENQDTRIFSGEKFTDYDGNSCYIYDINTSTNQGNIDKSYIIKWGTTYKYNYNALANNASNNTQLVFHITEDLTVTKDILIQNAIGSGFQEGQKLITPIINSYNNQLSMQTYPNCFASPWSNVYGDTIIYKSSDNVYKLVLVSWNRTATGKSNTNDTSKLQIISLIKNLPINPSNIDVNLKRGSNVDLDDTKSALINIGKKGIPEFIQEEEPEVTYTELDADNPVIPEDPEEPDTPDTPTEPIDPSGSTPTGGFQLPDGSFNFKMPDLNIDWSLDGLQNKFPLSIPFDIIHFLEAVDAEPETPSYTINFTFRNITINDTIDLHAFDDIMPLFRNIIAVGYCIFLIVATRGLFKVY